MIDEVLHKKRGRCLKRFKRSLYAMISGTIAIAAIRILLTLPEWVDITLIVLWMSLAITLAISYVFHDQAENEYLRHLNDRLDAITEEVEESCDEYRRIIRQSRAGGDAPVVVGTANDRYEDTTEIDEVIVQMHQRGVFQKVPEGYIGYVPELPGANTQGDTLEEARANLFEAIEMTLEVSNQTARENEGDGS